MQFYKHKEFGNIFIMTRQPSIQPNVREYIELETNNHHLITSDLLKPVTFQEAFSDEIESIVRQYKDSTMNLESDLDYQKKIHGKDIDKLNEFHEANSKLKEKADLFLEARNELILKNSALLGNNNQLREEIENLKIERDQLVIDYDELERKQFDNVIDNNEYALKTENDSLKKALDKLSDLAVKFYLKSEGVIL